MNADIRARLVSLAIQSEEQATVVRERAAQSHESGYLDHAIWLEGLAERAEKRAARCREKLEGEPS